DQARLQLAEEGGVGGQLLREPFADPVAAAGRTARELLQARGSALDEEIALSHRLVGGASPVAIRQIVEAARRAAIVAPAPRPAYRPVQSSFRSMPDCLPVADSAKPGSYCNSMEPRARSLSKLERQRLISSVVSRRRSGSQQELAAALGRAGCSVTQATVSRDIRELRLEKTTDQLGRPRYVLPGSRRVEPRDALVSVLERFGMRATAAESIVVVQSELGSAPAIARALDQLE